MRRVIGSVFLVVIGASCNLAAAEDAKTEAVRKLTVKVGLPELGKLAGIQGLTTLRSTEEMEKLVGEGVAKQLASQIDFSKEQLIVIGWTKKGPPFATLEYGIKDEEGGKLIRYFLKQPKPGGVHGNVAMRVNDFFAVPKGFKVDFEKGP